METSKNMLIATLVLSAVGGYCDTATFVAGGAIFSAHVTGNFIVFAAQIATGGSVSAYIKLISFPVFVIAVVIGGWMIRKQYPILLIQSILLIIAGIAAAELPAELKTAQIPIYTIVMVTVFAMGLQNAFGKVFAKSTYGPTTMMTGNVTQAALDMGSLLLSRPTDPEATRQSLKKGCITLSGFLGGCIAGAALGKQWGLMCLFMPGIAMLFCYFTTYKQLYIANK